MSCPALCLSFTFVGVYVYGNRTKWGFELSPFSMVGRSVGRSFEALNRVDKPLYGKGWFLSVVVDDNDVCREYVNGQTFEGEI